MDSDRSDAETPLPSTCDCKVGRVAARYGLDDLDRTLVRYWRGDGPEQYSLRELETYVNQAILQTEVTASGMDPIEGEVENLHRLLVNDDVSEGARTELVRRLEREGVDVADLRDAFVSHQSVHTHLRDCLGVRPRTADDTPEARREKVADTVFALRNRTEAVTQNSLERLRATDAIALDEFDVLVDVSVTCAACGRVYDVDTLLADEGCPCQHD
jgi:hypothetical protein